MFQRRGRLEREYQDLGGQMLQGIARMQEAVRRRLTRAFATDTRLSKP